MIKRIYGTYRPTYYNKGEGQYTPSFRLDQQYEDYLKAGLTKTLDLEIPEERYIGEIAPGVKKKTRFIIGEYNEDYINVNDYIANVKNVGAEFQIEIFATPAVASQWIRDNTDLVEESEGKFLINEASEMMGEEGGVAEYLIIE